MFSQSLSEAINKINVDELGFCKDFDELDSCKEPDFNDLTFMLENTSTPNNPSYSEYAFTNIEEEIQFRMLIPALKDDLIRLKDKALKDGNEKQGKLFLRLCKTEGAYESFLKAIKRDFMELYQHQSVFKDVLPQSFEWFKDIMNKKLKPVTQEEYRKALRAPHKFSKRPGL